VDIRSKYSSSEGGMDFCAWEDALFVHVPPFEVIDSDKQLEFVHALMQTLGDMLCV